ncbi:hypothetical protein [Raineyella sp. W15-4]|uniref:hypothetical protein n=1 Tax=Raineyella sp. W15-4 TaxID=3081651 RepID=UPI002954AEF3|nr:hypothetical protein [Raineyella sp. W15-4]WOQ16223.1 hypothetical protein R0145_13550 [Raineyella sp. W15-4]
MSAPKMRGWVNAMSDAVKARAASGNRDVIGVLVHRDADTADPVGRLAEELNGQLAGLPVDARAIVPVQETEAWWLAYPAALAAIRSWWAKAVHDPSGDTERIAGPKELLQRQTRRTTGDSRGQYVESDSRAIAAQIVLLPGWRGSWRGQAPPSLERALQAVESVGDS